MRHERIKHPILRIPCLGNLVEAKNLRIFVGPSGHSTGKADNQLTSHTLFTNMGRNKFSQHEIEQISKLLRLKNAGNRAKQKLVRHDLRVDYEFNISDFNEPGKAFGEEELQDAIRRGAIEILDDATIAAMKEKRARDKARDEAQRQQEALDGGATDWQAAMREWEQWEENRKTGNHALEE